jgi:hypothetical protein
MENPYILVCIINSDYYTLKYFIINCLLIYNSELLEQLSINQLLLTLPQNKSRSIIHETTFIKSPPSDYIKSRVFVNIFYVLVFENAVLVYETLF